MQSDLVLLTRLSICKKIIQNLNFKLCKRFRSNSSDAAHFRELISSQTVCYHKTSADIGQISATFHWFCIVLFCSLIVNQRHFYEITVLCCAEFEVNIQQLILSKLKKSLEFYRSSDIPGPCLKRRLEINWPYDRSMVLLSLCETTSVLK